MYSVSPFMPGFRIGHAQDREAITGCTVILCEAGAVGGIDQRGGAPGTRESDALRPMHLVQQVHGVVLSGGSAFGLDSAAGVVRYLEERGVGFDVGVAKVPIVPAAILFDLAIGDPKVRPSPEMGYQACIDAEEAPPAQGNVGAGMGATVGKLFGMDYAVKSGLGCAVVGLPGGVRVAAVVAVNAFGDVVDPQTGAILAGARIPPDFDISTDGGVFANTQAMLKNEIGRNILNFASGANTVIGAVLTNADFNKEQINKVAQMAHDGLARAIRPAHTMLDGDTIFALASGELPADVNIVGACAAEVFAEAIINAAKNAQLIAGIPAIVDLPYS
jgi:L-aminopeptidase/D-esterase-like protein